MTSAQCWAMCTTWFHSSIFVLALVNTLMVFDIWRRNRPRH